jgi:DNA-binding SARP family transcriptional activator/tetratricopeptide (TPR) repeat protein
VLTVDLLGPLRVSVAGRPVELPTGRLRALLAVLALSAGRTVPTERLATAVWGLDTRGDPRANVRTNVRRLRRLLGTADRQLIAARPGGYVLMVEPDQVDALHFGRLFDEAAAAPDPAAERSRLVSALTLWRGAAFEGIKSDWMERSAGPALRERYLTALERRVDLDLASGSRPDPAELTGLAEQHPLRESLWVRLLRVLDAAGRPAEALDQYETIRRRLADELGADPSPELQQVHATLLACGAAPPAGAAAPRQLPAAVNGFAGRQAELSALDALLHTTGSTRPGSPLIAVIAGTAGVGKTTLAVHWAHRIADRFPDGQLYADLRGYHPSGQAVPAATAVREFLDALRVPPHHIPDSLAAQAGHLRSLLAGRRMLVLLDNARDADQVAPLLPAGPGCLVLVTSRDQLTGLVMNYGAHPLTLKLLPADAARRLLAHRLGPDRLAASPVATERIVSSCAGLPLALAIVAAHAAIDPAHPLDALADELHDALGMLDRAVPIRAIFSWSYETLGEAAARLFRLVGGLHTGSECTLAAAASLAGEPVSRVHASLAELTRAHLLTEHAPGRYSCHDLLRAYAIELCAARDADQDAARQRAVDHYVHTAYAAQQLLGGDVAGDLKTVAPAAPGPGVCVTALTGADEATAWFAAERTTLLAVLTLAADLGLDPQVCQLAQAIFGFLHGRGFWHERAETQRAAVAAARRLGDPVEECRAYRNLAFALADLGRFDEAHRYLDAALQRSQDDPASQAWTHYRRDIVYALQGRETDALDAARRAHDLFERLGDHVGRAIALTDLGFHHGRLGNHAQALELCEQALVLHHKLGNLAHEAHTWSCLADTHLQLGDPAGAIPCFRQALNLFREFRDPYAEASTLAHLGACHHLSGNPAAAAEQWRHANALLRDLDPSATEQIQNQLAIIDRSVADAFRQRP